MNTTSQLQIQANGKADSATCYLFEDQEVRIYIDMDGEIWFLAKDVFQACDIAWKGTAGSLKNYPKRWVRVWQCQTPQGVQEMVFIAEGGVYQTLFNSRKPAALQFIFFVFDTILPNYRRARDIPDLTPAEHVQLVRQLGPLIAQLSEGNELYINTMYPAAVQIASRLGLVIPPKDAFLAASQQLQLPGV